MSEYEEAKSKASKASAAPVRNPDELRIRELKFRGSVDLGIEQQVARINTFARSDKVRYEIHYLPRIDKYRVREWQPSTPEGDPPKSAMLVSADWCVGFLEESP